MMTTMLRQRSIAAAATLVAVALAAATAGLEDLHGQERDSPRVNAARRTPVRVLQGRFTNDVTLTAGVQWIISGEVFVASSARFVVPAGTRVVADLQRGGTLMLERGAQVIIVGDGMLEAPLLTDVELVLENPLAATSSEPAPEAGTAEASVPTPATDSTAAAPHGLALALAPAVVSAPVLPDRRALAPARASGAHVVTRSIASVRAGTVSGPGQPAKANSLYTGRFPVTGATVRMSDLVAATRAVSRGVEEAAAGSAVKQELGTANADGSVLQVVGPPAAVPGLDKPVRVIHGRFTSDLHLTNDTYWVLRGAVFIGAPARIIIDPGTRVVGELATTGALIIERGARIIADGTAAQPIVFTSDQPPGFRGRGDWGGLIINGNAPLNVIGGVAVGEGDTGVYGGTDPDDSSGILRYVRVEFAGIEFSPDNELNGIAFQGVGRGTIVDHIQVAFNKDDGIEMFGGTVDIKHAVLTGIGDDSIDWTDGWQGRAQFLVVQQRGDDADRGIEADNNGDNNDLLPRSKPAIYNITLIGDPDANEGPESTQGVELREGTAATLRNFIVVGFKQHAMRVSGASSAAQVAAGELTARHGLVFGNGTDLHSSAAPLVAASGGTIDVVDPQLIAPFDHAAPTFRPAPGSPALTMGFETPPADGFFDTAVTFRGALSGDAAEDWTLGWTNYDQN